MNGFVVDASCAAAWCLEDEASPQTDVLLAQLNNGDIAHAPALWCWEMGNLLIICERLGRIDTARLDPTVAFLKTLPVTIDAEGAFRAWGKTRQLAQTHALSGYNASYLELALRMDLPLATLDRSLARVAAALGVKLLLAA